MPLDGSRTDRNIVGSSERPADIKVQSRFQNESLALRERTVLPIGAGNSSDRSAQAAEDSLQTLLKSHAKPKDGDRANQGWIEALASKNPNIAELKMHYPPNDKGKTTSIKLGLDAHGKLVSIGDELAKGKDGLWHERKTDGTLGAITARQNYSFDLQTGRYTYASKTEGKWIDLSGDKGKVTIESIGNLVYRDKNGQLEHKARIDGSKIYYDADGRHAYTIRPDGSKFDVKGRIITTQLTNGESKVQNVDDGSVRIVLASGRERPPADHGRINSEGTGRAAVAERLAAARAEYNKTFREKVLPELLKNPNLRVNGKSIANMPVNELARRHALAQADGKDFSSFDDRHASKLSKVPAVDLANAFRVAQSSIARGRDRQPMVADAERNNVERTEIGEIEIPKL